MAPSKTIFEYTHRRWVPTCFEELGRSWSLLSCSRLPGSSEPQSWGLRWWSWNVSSIRSSGQSIFADCVASIRTARIGEERCRKAAFSPARRGVAAPRYLYSDGRCGRWLPLSTNEEKTYDLHEAWWGFGISKPQCGPMGQNSDSAPHSFPLGC